MDETSSQNRRDWMRYAGASAALLLGARARAARPAGAAADGGPRILHVMSFESPWRWTDGQFAGFREALALPQAGFRVFQMDVKRNSSPEAKERVAREARALIDSWQPDLVYASDDDAQAYVTRHYVGRALPFVFSGVNRMPADHGLQGAPNVAGVLEQEHFVESARLLRTLVPGIRRLAVICDEGTQWAPVITRVQQRMDELTGLSLATVDRVRTWAEFQARVRHYPSMADAVLYLGIFTLQDGSGRNVAAPVVQRWVAEHSRLPDMSFWIDRVHHGTLASVTVSEVEQGRAAGALARAILVGRAAPASLPLRPSTHGRPAISLARARQLGIAIRSTQLLQSEIVKRFEWDAPA